MYIYINNIYILFFCFDFLYDLYINIMMNDNLMMNYDVSFIEINTIIEYKTVKINISIGYWNYYC